MSDTEWLAIELAACANDEALVNLLSYLEGAYSIIFYNQQSDTVYFARDSLGRNSLLLQKQQNGLRLTSVSFKHRTDEECEVMELPPLGLFKIENISTIQSLNELSLYAWSSDLMQQEDFETNVQSIETTFNIKCNVYNAINCTWLSKSVDINLDYDFYDIVQENGTTKEILHILLQNEAVNKSMHILAQLLDSSVSDRVLKTTNTCRKCISEDLKNCQHAKIAILFSGGIDCTLLALIAHKYVDKSDAIELINVAFAPIKPTKHMDWDSYKINAPDRVSALTSYNELKQLCPDRKWNLVEVNVTRSQLTTALETHIKHLIYPLKTVLDESIGCAFWFASQGEGVCAEENYETTARVVLVGSGADELFGGYMRHRNAYKRCNGTLADKLACVEEELEHDWRRIPARNLARDDRVIADTGKTPRAPFIEERLVQFVRNLKAAQRCCYLLEEGLGDKLLLRLYAFKLGLKNACGLKKRAIQFGSRIANSKQNANDLSVYLQYGKT